jgi:hypothetical protein
MTTAHQVIPTCDVASLWVLGNMEDVVYVRVELAIYEPAAPDLPTTSSRPAAATVAFSRRARTMMMLK